MNKLKKLGVLIVAVAMIFTLVACGNSDEGVIRITNKNYTEQRLLGQVMKVYLESKGFETEISELGGSALCFAALENDNVDIYVEYTGTAYGEYLKHSEILSADETYDVTKSEMEEQYGITWLEPLGFNNTYVLSVTSKTAEELNIASISDIIPLSGDMELGCDNEFPLRADGLPGLMETYAGLEFKKVNSMDQGLTYTALNEGQVDINVSYATDGRIAKYNLVNLQDDKNFFPPYYAAPIMKQEFADANPEVVEALSELSGKFTDETMQKYNLMVDEGGDPDDVATQMLQDLGLIE
ncbi:MAG: glycine betaine ABC transporter substrate-binding protein [Sedimentibacter sp.]